MPRHFKKGNTSGFKKGCKPHNASDNQTGAISDMNNERIYIRPSEETYNLAFDIPEYGLKPQEPDQSRSVTVLRPRRYKEQEPVTEIDDELFERYSRVLVL